MPTLNGDPSRGLVLSLRALEPTDYALPELWNDPFQILLDNDAHLNSRVAALEGALGGTNTALGAHRTANPIDHPDGSVTTQKLANGSVTTPKLADGSVTNEKLANGSVTGEKIAPNSIPLDRLVGGGIPYDLLIYSPGYILGNQVLARLILPRNLVLAPTGHAVSSGVAPAANWSAQIKRNEVSIGTVFIPGGGVTGTISLTARNLAAGDILTIVAQPSADPTLQGVSITLKGVV